VGLRAGPSGGLRLGTSARNGSSNRWTTSTTGRSDLTALEMFDELALAGGLAAIFLPIAVMTPGAFVIVVFLAIPVVLLALAGALLTVGRRHADPRPACRATPHARHPGQREAPPGGAPIAAGRPSVLRSGGDRLAVVMVVAGVLVDAQQHRDEHAEQHRYMLEAH
jgi:hypothetical protein